MVICTLFLLVLKIGLTDDVVYLIDTIDKKINRPW
jgi:hypothetical protein